MRRSGHFLARVRPSSWPLISGITMSVTTRSMAPAWRVAMSTASTPFPPSSTVKPRPVSSSARTARTPSSSSTSKIVPRAGVSAMLLPYQGCVQYRVGIAFRDGRPIMTEGSALIRGLEGVVAAETKLCDLDGRNGRLAYCGYDIDELARQATFEEVCYLLWHGELPSKTQLDRFQVELIGARTIPPALVDAFRLIPRDTDPMRVLQASVAILGMHDGDATDNSREANLRKALRLTSQFATAICAHHRVRSGEAPVPPTSDLSHAANFLYMLTGKRPTDVVAKALDASLTLYAEHELNASTFTTRVIAATLSDMHSAVAGGVGALKGTLHGGAGEAVMRTLLEI